MTLRGTASLDATARTIVGVVTDLKEETIYRPAPPTVYVPIGQAATIRLAFLLRTVRGGVDGRREVIRDGARLLATDRVRSGRRNLGRGRAAIDGLRVDRTSAATFVVAAAVLAVAVLSGCYVPARRASRLDPARVLSTES